MELSKVLSKKNIADINELNRLYEMSNVDYKEHVGLNDDVLEAFYEGDHWFHKDLKRALLYNAQGRPIYDFRSTYETNKGDEVFSRPRRTVNLIKSNIKSIIASFSEVNPFPIAQKVYDYLDIPEINTLLDKHELLAHNICEHENDLQHYYQLIVEKTLQYGRSFFKVIIDEDHAITNVPVKYRYISPKNIRVDPEAITLDEADYVCEIVRMHYGEAMDKFAEILSDVTTSEPDMHTMIEIKQWWLRQSGTKGKKNKWSVIYQYNNRQIYKKKDDKINKDIEIYDFLPYECFRTEITDKWWAQSIVIDIIESQKEYNKVKSEQDFNYMMTIEPPLRTNMEARNVKTGMRPNGIIPTKPNDILDPIKNTIVDSGMFEQRLQMIKTEFAAVFGDIDLMQGRRPTGVYSGRMLETLQKANQLKLKVIEGLLLNSLKNLYIKGLKLLSKYIGGLGVKLFNYKQGNWIIINEDDINNTLYKIDIDTKDANLMTNDAKFQAITQLMQYAKIQEKLHPYYICELVNNSIPDLIPDNVMNALKTDMNQTVVPQGTQGIGMSNTSMPPMQSGGQQGVDMSAPADNTNDNSVTLQFNDFVKAINEYDAQLTEEGIPETAIKRAFSQLIGIDEDDYQDFLEGKVPLDPNSDLEDMLNNIDIFVNKAKNISQRNDLQD